MSESICIDIIILSYAKTESLKELTNQSIQTLLESENPDNILFNIVVIESNKELKPHQFVNSKTIYPDQDFGFHKFLNIGIRATHNRYICLCNNDLIFHKGWASEILNAMQQDYDLLSASPYCPNFHSSKPEINKDINYGYINGIHLAGWCIFIRRELFNTIGYLDEKLKYWYCDNDYGLTLKKFNIKHALINKSKVTHIGNIKTEVLNKDQLFDYTYGQFIYFTYKWNNNNKLLYLARKAFLPLFQYLYLKKKQNKLYKGILQKFTAFYGGQSI